MTQTVGSGALVRRHLLSEGPPASCPDTHLPFPSTFRHHKGRRLPHRHPLPHAHAITEKQAQSSNRERDGPQRGQKTHHVSRTGTAWKPSPAPAASPEHQGSRHRAARSGGTCRHKREPRAQRRHVCLSHACLRGRHRGRGRTHCATRQNTAALGPTHSVWNVTVHSACLVCETSL